MQKPKPIVLAIGGFDPCAGAGVLADVKTIEAIGGYGMAAITANTFQNESEFDRSDWVSESSVLEQIAVLQRKHTFQSVKIGLVEHFYQIHNFALPFGETVPIVWDPVLKASAGFTFHSDIEKNQLFKLLERITVLTPNLPEAEQLFGTHSADKIAEMLLPCAILLKGGHANNKADDVLIANGETHIIAGDKFEATYAKHGTGCVLSSAIATNLALGFSLLDACKTGKAYVEQTMKSNTGLLGYHSPLSR